jgi:SAM-dependent methyltransferase
MCYDWPMKLAPSEIWTLFKQESRQHGLIGGLKRALDPKVQRLASRKLIANYTRPHDLGVELGQGLTTITPAGTKLVDVHHAEPVANTVATERFSAEQFPYEEMTFDFIVAEDLPSTTNAQKALKEWYRVMNEGGHVFILGGAESPGAPTAAPSGAPTKEEWLKQLGQTPATSSWEVLEVVDAIADKTNAFAIIARRKRERSGIIEVLKMQQSSLKGASDE